MLRVAILDSVHLFDQCLSTSSREPFTPLNLLDDSHSNALNMRFH